MTIAILAGGAASRMGGADKASLPLNGRRIIDRQVETLRHVSDSIIVVGGQPDRFRDLGVRAVPDVYAGCGALGGIYSALLASDRPWTLVLACPTSVMRSPSTAMSAVPADHSGAGSGRGHGDAQDP